jgi:hypothetical protein
MSPFVLQAALGAAFYISLLGGTVPRFTALLVVLSCAAMDA